MTATSHDEARGRTGLRGRRGATAPSARQLVDLVVAYAKQETLGPLRGLVRFVAFGVLGAVALAGGGVLLLLALLRLLQGETGTAFAGNRSWVPYVIVAVAAVAVAGLALWRITRGPAVRRRPAAGGATERAEGPTGVGSGEGGR